MALVLERMVGDLALADDVAVVAAANPPDQAADGWDLSGPLANRFCHLDWSVDASGIAEGFIAGFPAPSVVRLPDGWQGWTTRTRAQVASFLQVRPGLVSAPPLERAAAGRAWPSPRSWEMAARLLVAARSVDAPPDVVAQLVVGSVGPVG